MEKMYYSKKRKRLRSKQFVQKGEIWTLDTHTHLDGKKYEDPGRRWPSTSQEGKPETHPSVTIPRRNQFCLHLDFGLLASRTVRQ